LLSLLCLEQPHQAYSTMVNFAKEFNQFVTNITFGSGDFVSLFSLFFDNLSTLLGLSGAILGLPSSSPILREIVFERVVPAAGIMLFLGNVYYCWQATRMTVKYNHPYTAQPYGLNTSGGFPFVFGIIYGVYFNTVVACTEDTDTCNAADEETKRVELAWRVCVTANFLTGLINIFLGFFGQALMTIFPVGAMLIPLAGIGFTWLALNQIAANFATPAIGLIPVFLIFTQYYGMGRFHLGKGWYLPEALPIVIFGVIAGWSYGLNDTVADPVKPGAYIGSDFLDGFSDIGPYMGIVLPFSIAASFGDMMCLVSAQKCGDPYPIRETMIVDGLGTLIGAILGCPFGTVVCKSARTKQPTLSSPTSLTSYLFDI
jgi:AGZA family xanthine/uracil permease-like MFS transporter